MAFRDASELNTGFPIAVDLRGPQGNAFALLGLASQLWKQLPDVLRPEDKELEDVLSEMKSGDYENLLQVFDSYFGKFVNLYR